MSRGRLLLVDDEPALRRVISRALVSAGFEVANAADGAAALALFQLARVDAVISDVRMPVMGGLELLGRLRAHDPELPVVLISASTELQTKSDAVQLGAFDFLQKPLDLSELEDCAARAVAARS